jgi:nucleotide-binding universal stress UspA family protein
MFPTKILLATDGSEEAAQAGRMAVALAEKTGSALHVVYVEPLPHPYSLSEATIYYPEMRDEVRQTANEEAREKLAAEVEKIGATRGIAGSHARIGHPDAEISHLAEEIGAGLIVMGSRGLGPVRRLLVGSVSNSVVRHAHGPVHRYPRATATGAWLSPER